MGINDHLQLLKKKLAGVIGPLSLPYNTFHVMQYCT